MISGHFFRIQILWITCIICKWCYAFYDSCMLEDKTVSDSACYFIFIFSKYKHRSLLTNKFFERFYILINNLLDFLITFLPLLCGYVTFRHNHNIWIFNISVEVSVSFKSLFFVSKLLVSALVPRWAWSQVWLVAP